MIKEEYKENILLYKKYVLFMFAIFLLSAAGVFMEKKRHNDYLENSAIKRKFEVYSYDLRTPPRRKTCSLSKRKKFTFPLKFFNFFF